MKHKLTLAGALVAGSLVLTATLPAQQPSQSSQISVYRTKQSVRALKMNALRLLCAAMSRSDISDPAFEQTII